MKHFTYIRLLRVDDRETLINKSNYYALFFVQFLGEAPINTSRRVPWKKLSLENAINHWDKTGY